MSTNRWVEMRLVTLHGLILPSRLSHFPRVISQTPAKSETGLL